jgi:hypothetical protein
MAQKRLIMPVIRDAFEMTPLNSPAITRTIPIQGVRGTLPIMSNTPVESQLKEFEHSTVKNAGLSNFDLHIYKDRVMLAVSDEAEMEVGAAGLGSFMSLQQAQASDALASNLNKLIAEQLNTTPQLFGTTGALGNWSATTAKPTLQLGKMAAQMGIYRPTAFVMGTLAAEYYTDYVGDKSAVANISEWKNAASMHPTLQVPIFASTDIDNLDASGNLWVYGVTNRVPGIITVPGAIKAHSEYDADLGAEVHTFNIWRSPFSNIRQTSDDLNLGVVKGIVSEA